MRRLHYFLLKLHFGFLKQARVVIYILLPLLLMAGYFSTKTRIAVRTEDFSDKNLESYKKLEELKSEYAFEDKLTLIINKGSAFNDKDLCQIENWMDAEYKDNQSILQVASLFDLRGPDYHDGKLFYPRLIKDPCESDIQYERLKNHPLLPMFSTPEISDLVIHLKIKPSEVTFKHGIYDYALVEDLIAKAKKNLPFEIIPGGTLFFQASVLEGIRHSQLVNLAASLVLILLYFWFYRSVLATITMVGIILITNTFIKAGMTLSGHLLDPLSSCIFLMITVAILEDYVLLSFMLFKKKMRFNHAIKNLLLPSFLTSLTTAIGFGSLSVSDNPSIVHFSIWTAFGAMFEWVAMFLIIPCLVNMFPRIKNKIESHPVPRRIVPDELISYTPKKVATLILALVPFALFFIHNQANLNYSPYDMFPSDHAASRFREHLTSTRHSEGEISVVFNNMNQDLAPYVEKIKQDPLVSNVHSEVDVKEQLLTIPPELHSLILQDFFNTPLGKLFKSKTSKRIIVSIKSYNTKDVPFLVQRLEAICQKDCSLRSEIITANDYAQGVLKTLYESVTSGFSFILLLITWLVVSLSRKHFFPVIISTVWASLALLLIVVIFQFKINIVTCVALSVLIGAAGDNAIQFLLFKKKSLYGSVKEIGQASSENFILMIGISSTLMFSYFQTPRILCLLLMIGVVFMFVGDLWVLNGLSRIMVDEKDED